MELLLLVTSLLFKAAICTNTYYRDFSAGPFRREIYGVAISGNSTILNNTVDSICKCKSACFVMPNCTVVSAIPNTNGQEVECLMSNFSVSNASLHKAMGITFVKKLGYLDYYFPAEDGFFYFFNSSRVTMSVAHESCNSTFNGRLPILRTMQQLEIAKNISSYTGAARIGLLLKNTFSPYYPKWFDGTEYTLGVNLLDGMSSSSYKISNQIKPFFNFGASESSKFLCQINIYGIENNW